MIFTLEELAQFLGGEASEKPGPKILGVRPVEYAGANDITYVTGPQFLDKLSKSGAGAVIIGPDLAPKDLPHILSRNPEADFAQLTALYYAYPREPLGVSARAEIHPEAILGDGVSIGPFAVVGKGAELGDRVTIGSHVSIGDDVHVDADTRIFPNVVIYPRVRIGRRVIIHSGTIIGSDGFGYARDVDENGAPVSIKKYHSGTVEIEDDVEIGALCAVDRALSGCTRLGKGVKLDNLVQIAHNVEIGPGTVIAAQAGIAGSSSVGASCVIAGQAGVRDHVAVGQGVVLATRVGIYRDVPDGAVMGGAIPGMPYNVFLRTQGLFKRLPEMLDRIRKLERFLQIRGKENS
ncbi:MAG TPA: UDP-3-O-(3-hydroxymyristoyl)glucosamine N-acyltransferase [Desulfomonilaceae bacterium]|nr:UDP-3-O-(3-hydroxymyristoyl)glucosamine N-acyltransferase [Desulfomonilaceae bacterium]